MDAIRRIVTLQYIYANPVDQRRARGLMALNWFSIIFTIVSLILGFVVWRDDPFNPLVTALELIWIVWSLFQILFLQRGRLILASWMYVGFLVVGPLAVILIMGLEALMAFALGLPLVAAGLLMSRRETLIVTGLMIGGVILVGVLRALLGEPMEDLVGSVTLAVMLLVFYGLLLWLFAGEFRELFERLFGAERNIQAVSALSQQIAQMADPDAFLNEASELLREDFGLLQMRVYLWDAEQPDSLQLRGGTGLMARRVRLGGQTIPLDEAHPFGEAFLHESPVSITLDDPPIRRREFWPGAGAELILPLQVAGQTLGVVDLQSGDAVFFQDAWKVATLSALVNQMGVTIQAMNMARTLQQQAGDLDRLYAQVQRRNEEVQQLNRQIAGGAWGQFFGGRGAGVIGYDLGPDAGEPVPGTAIDASIEATLRAGEVAIRATPEGQVLSVPVVVRGQALGAMEFLIASPDPLPENLLDLAETIAGRLSLALDNARLLEQVRALARREQAISAASARMQTADDLDYLLTLAAEEFNNALGGLRTHIRLQMADTAPAS